MKELWSTTDLTETQRRGAAGLLLTVLLSSALSTGCVKRVPHPTTAAPVVETADPSGRRAVWTDQLVSAEKRWAASGILSYDFTLRVQCFCVGEMTEPNAIRVTKGVGVLLTPRNSATRAYMVQLDTVEELFFVARDWIRRLPFKLTLAFDGEHGYPTLIDVDPRQMMSDEEVKYLVSDFVVTGRRAR